MEEEMVSASVLPAVGVPLIEPLESRRMLAFATLSAGVLTINGTSGNDTIIVRQTTVNNVLMLTVRLNAQPRLSFTNSAVKSLKIFGGSGNDRVIGALKQKNYIDGGSGDDTLYGGELAD